MASFFRTSPFKPPFREIPWTQGQRLFIGYTPGFGWFGGALGASYSQEQGAQVPKSPIHTTNAGHV